MHSVMCVCHDDRHHPMSALWFAVPGALFWLTILCLPWQPWRVRELLDSGTEIEEADLSDVTVLIPARNEAEALPHTLRALARQGRGLRVVIADDQSEDDTASIARRWVSECDCVVRVTTPPAGWSGKLWALEQALTHASTPLLLLLDADIVLAPGILAALVTKLRTEGRQLVSLMARLRTESLWERALMPAFVYFFKLLYPFHLANRNAYPRIAAAAGGCILLEAQALQRIGGFARLRGALIDDCALAAQVKRAGGSIWVGLTHCVESIRRYDTLQPIWNMVARSAFTQLRHSWLLLCALSVIFAIAFWLPLIALISGEAWPMLIAAIAWAAMCASYLPMVRFYRLSSAWMFALPIVAALFLAMSWSSAWRWQFGAGAMWKGRNYLSHS